MEKTTPRGGDPLIHFYTNKLTAALENPYVAIKEQYGNAMLVFSNANSNISIMRVKIITVQGRIICDCSPQSSISIISPAHAKLCSLWNTPNAHIIPLGIDMNTTTLRTPVKIYLTFKQSGDFPMIEEIDPAHLKIIL